MAKTELEEYKELYPHLPKEILSYFDGNTNGAKKISNFCDHYKKTYQTKNLPQPRVVVRLCELLQAKSMLSFTGSTLSNVDGMGNSYICFLKSDFSKYAEIINEKIWFALCGFSLIYETYKESVRAIQHIKENGDSHLGTAFLFNGKIITAKHCIEGAKRISIHGFTKKSLVNSKILFHKDANMDLAIITIESSPYRSIHYSDEAKILSDVITMGYPLLAGFQNFITTEKAQVSSRFTVTKGQVAAEGEDIWLKRDLLLITAKIKGGNSGGPVIDENGSIVAVTSQENFGTGEQYDNLGYGVAIPIKYVEEDMISGRNVEDVTSKYEIVDFE